MGPAGHGRRQGRSVFYGPGTVEPETPDPAGSRQAGGQPSSRPTVPGLLRQRGPCSRGADVAKHRLGEDPRAIDGNVSTKPVETATAASGAVDVVRVSLLDTSQVRAADVRIGHLESAVAVPEGGITCGIGLAKNAIPEQVSAGQPFKWALKSPTPTTARSSKSSSSTTSRPPTGVKYTVTGTSPKADSMTDEEIDLERPRLTRQGQIQGVVPSTSWWTRHPAVAPSPTGPWPAPSLRPRAARQGEGGARRRCRGRRGQASRWRSRSPSTCPRVSAVLAAPAEVPATCPARARTL